MTTDHSGVTHYEEDRERGPFLIRIGGSNDFVSHIDPNDRSCAPPGSVDCVSGWENPSALRFSDMDRAIEAADQVWAIEGIHTSIEARGERAEP